MGQRRKSAEQRLVRLRRRIERDLKEVCDFAQLIGNHLHIGRGIAEEKCAALRSQFITQRRGQRRVTQQLFGNDDVLDRGGHGINAQCTISNAQGNTRNCTPNDRDFQLELTRNQSIL